MGKNGNIWKIEYYKDIESFKFETLPNGNNACNIASVDNLIINLKEELQYLQDIIRIYKQRGYYPNCCIIEKEKMLLEIIQALKKSYENEKNNKTIK